MGHLALPVESAPLTENPPIAVIGRIPGELARIFSWHHDDFGAFRNYKAIRKQGGKAKVIRDIPSKVVALLRDFQ